MSSLDGPGNQLVAGLPHPGGPEEMSAEHQRGEESQGGNKASDASGLGMNVAVTH